jgi:DNA anti-recombination protein RmuC
VRVTDKQEDYKKQVEELRKRQEEKFKEEAQKKLREKFRIT